MEIVKINLENEMDLILAHKRCIKLAELCGLSVLIQTSFATAVSEISRCVINDKNDKPTLNLGINILKNNRKELYGSIYSKKDLEKHHPDALKYARRLSDKVSVVIHKTNHEIVFTQSINYGGLINEEKIASFITYFKKELPLSPYDEIRKKNIQLLELSEKLQNSENQYRLLTETIPLMMFTTNGTGVLTYANKWLKDFFNLAEVQPGKLSWTSFIDNDVNRNIKAEWDKSMSSLSPFRAVARLKSSGTNELLWHLISVIPVKNDQNNATSWTGFFVDIHAQKLVEETLKNNADLKAAQKQLLSSQVKLEEKIVELNKSNHDLEQFAYIASHDLQEPLRKIRTFSDLLDKNIKNEVKAEFYIRKIDVASSRMLSLIKDVLNYSRLSKSESNFETVDSNEILKSVQVDMELMIEEKKAKITVQGLPVINGISQQLYQLFYNLISNGLKFCTSDPVIVIKASVVPPEEVRKIAELHNGVKYYKFTIRDNGIGFEQKYAKQIFSIFKRLNSKETYAGTGIGLALCKKIVDNHHGLISVTSEVGKGTEFQVILPEA